MAKPKYAPEPDWLKKMWDESNAPAKPVQKPSAPVIRQSNGIIQSDFYEHPTAQMVQEHNDWLKSISTPKPVSKPIVSLKPTVQNFNTPIFNPIKTAQPSDFITKPQTPIINFKQTTPQPATTPKPANAPAKKSWWQNFLDTQFSDDYAEKHDVGITDLLPKPAQNWLKDVGHKMDENWINENLTAGAMDLALGVKNLGRMVYKGITQQTGNDDYLKTGVESNYGIKDINAHYQQNKDPILNFLNEAVDKQDKQLEALQQHIASKKEPAWQRYGGQAIQLIPTIVATAYSGGLLGAGGETAEVLGNMGKIAKVTQAIKSMLPFGAVTFGQASRQAEKEGATYKQQVGYGLAQAGITSASQLLLMPSWMKGMMKLGGQEVMESGVRKFAGAWGMTGLHYLGDIAKQGVGMALTSPASNLAKKEIYAPDTKVFDPKQMLEQGISGAVMSAMMGAYGLPETYRSNRMAHEMMVNASRGIEVTDQQREDLIHEFQHDQEIAQKNGEFERVAKENQKDTFMQSFQVLKALKNDGVNFEQVLDSADKNKSVHQILTDQGTQIPKQTFWEGVKKDSGLPPSENAPISTPQDSTQTINENLNRRITPREEIKASELSNKLKEDYQVNINRGTNAKGEPVYQVGGEVGKVSKVLEDLGGTYYPNSKSWLIHGDNPAESLLGALEKNKQVEKPVNVGEAQTVNPKVGNDILMRIEEPGVSRATTDKPHGIYTSFADRESPHQLGGEVSYWRKNPNAKVLEVNTDETYNSPSREKDVKIGAGTGIHAVTELTDRATTDKLLATPKAELVDMMKEKYPSVDWSKYHDSHEIVEAYGGMLAKDKGYDAIQGNDTEHPQFSEYVILTDKGATPIDNPNKPEPAKAEPTKKAKATDLRAGDEKLRNEVRQKLSDSIKSQARDTALNELGFKSVDEVPPERQREFENLAQKYENQFGGNKAKAEPKLEPIKKKAEPVTKLEDVPAEDISQIKSVPVKDIKVDPERFQFKSNVDAETGAGNLLKGVNNYDPYKAGIVTLWEDKNGDMYVVNGHHRLELANRSDVKTVNAQILRESEGWTDKQAKLFGAKLNISEGRGTAIDSAKIFREQKITAKDLEKEGISLREGVASKGLDLSKLNDRLFSKVVNGDLSIDKGAIIGREFAGQEENQNAIMDLMQGLETNGRTVTQDRLKNLIDEVKNGETVATVQHTLFGDLVELKSNIANKLDILEGVNRTLKAKKNLFTNLTNAKKSEIAKMAGNILSADRNVVERNLSERALELINTMAHKKGNFVSDILNKYASQMEDGITKSEAIKQAFAEIESNIEKGDTLENYWNDTKGSGEVQEKGKGVQGTFEEVTAGKENKAFAVKPFESKADYQMEMADDLTHIDNIRETLKNIDNAQVKSILEDYVKELENKNKNDKAEADKFNQSDEQTEEEMRNKAYDRVMKTINEKPIPNALEPQDEVMQRRWIANSTMSAQVIPDEVKAVFRDNPQLSEYNQLHNQDMLEQANQELRTDFFNAVKYIRSLDYLGDAYDVALAIGVTKKLVMEGDTARIVAWQTELAEKSTRAGQGIQMLSVLKRFTPEWTLKQAQNKMVESYSPAERENVNRTSRDTSREMHQVNKDNIGEFADRVIKDRDINDILDNAVNDPATAKEVNKEYDEQVQQQGGTPGENTKGRNRRRILDPMERNRQYPEGETIPTERLNDAQDRVNNSDASERLANRVGNRMYEQKEREVNVLNDMVNTLFNIGKEHLPDNQTPPREPMEFIRHAMENKAEYRETWDRAKDIVEGRFKNDPEALETLQRYFGSFTDKPFSGEILDKAIRKEIKDKNINMDELIRTTDFNVEDSSRKFADKLVGEGMNPASAQELSDYIHNRFKGMVAEKRQSALERMMKPILEPITKKAPKTPAQILTEMSNLKAFVEDNQAFTEKKLQRIVRSGIKYAGIDLNELVRKHYSEYDPAEKDLYTKLTEAGIRPEDAKYLSTYIKNEFGKAVQEKKEAIMENLMKERTPALKKPKKEYYQKIIELSNLGAFGKEAYSSYVAKTLGLSSLTPETAQDIIRMADEIQTMPQTNPKEIRDRNIAIGRMMERIAREIPPTFLQKVSTLQTMAQLLNGKTMLRNVLSNFGFVTWEQIPQILSAGPDWLISKGLPEIGLLKFKGIKGTGVRTVGMPMPIEFWKGFYQGMKIGMGDALKGINTHEGIGTAFDLPKRTFRKGILNWMEKGLNMGLSAVDYGFKKGIYEESLAIQKKINKTDIVSEEMIDRATHLANYRTFNDTNWLSSAFSGFKMLLNDPKYFITRQGKPWAWGLGDLLIKYPRTPANLVMRGLEYSPAGVLKTLYEVARPGLFKKEFRQDHFTMSFARAIVGSTSLMGIGALLNKLGIMSGDPSKDPDELSMQKQTGLGAYQINYDGLRRFVLSGFNPNATKIQPGDRMFTYDWFQPFAFPMSLGAHLNESKGLSKQLWGIGDGLSSAMDTVENQSLFTGIKTAMQQRNLYEGGVALIKGMPASFMPTFVNQIKQLTDNQQYETKATTWERSAMNLAVNKVPWLAKMLLQPKIDTLGGNQQIYQGGTNSFGNVFFSPWFESKYKPIPEIQLVEDIVKQTGETKQLPRVPNMKITVNGNPYTLTAKEYHDYAQYLGKRTLEEFQNLNDQGYPPDEKTAGIMSSILTQLNTEAKLKILEDSRGLTEDEIKAKPDGTTSDTPKYFNPMYHKSSKKSTTKKHFNPYYN